MYMYMYMYTCACIRNDGVYDNVCDDQVYMCCIRDDHVHVHVF